MITFEGLVDTLTIRLGAGRRSGQSWKFVCPLHDDVNPSLHISPGDNGQALVWCFGCTEKVWDRLMAWLSDEDVTPTAGKPKGTGDERRTPAIQGRLAQQLQAHSGLKHRTLAFPRSPVGQGALEEP